MEDIVCTTHYILHDKSSGGYVSYEEGIQTNMMIFWYTAWGMSYEHDELK